MKTIFKVLCVFVCVFVHSCAERNNTQINLYTDIDKSVLSDERFNLDSVKFSYSSDSIIMLMNQFEIPFIEQNGSFYEVRKAYRDMIEYERTDSILTFSRNDTTFIYESVIDGDFIPNAFDYSLADCRYEIKKLGENSYKTTKQSLVDTTFKEIYYYDENYRIAKFVNIYIGNVCVYVPEL